VKNYAFLFWAYATIWIGLAAFVLASLVRIRRLDDRLERLERELARAERERAG
jgi:CcmD family protein